MSDLLAGLLVWAAATGAMLGLFKKFRMEFQSPLEALTFSSAFGLAGMGYLVFILGSLGFLYAAPVMVVVMTLLALFIRPLAAEFAGIFRVNRPSFRGLLYAAPAIVAAAFSLAGALAPAIGQDELCYHLMQPKNYLREHAVYEVRFSSSALWPYLMEMLFTLGMLLKGVGLAKFFHWAIALTAVSAVYCFTARFVGKKAALFAALGFWLTPAVFIQASFAYVDNALACFSFLSFYALFVYLKDRRLSWAVLAGISAGLAISVKFIGLFMIILIGPVFLFMAWREKNKARSHVRAAALFSAAVLAAGGVWYLRSWALRGNPFFPFYSPFFGGNGWHIDTYVDAHGRGGDFFSFLALLWDTAIHPEWFGGEHIGPFFLAFLPLVFLMRPLPGVLKFCLGFGLAYTVLWFKIDPNIRFFFPALAIFSVPAGASMAWLSGQGTQNWKRAAQGCFLALFFLLAAFSVYHFKDEAALLAGGDKERYLSRHERSYDVARQINSSLRPGDKLISVNEVRGYYFDAPFVIEGEVNRFTEYGKKFSTAAEVHGFLRREGFTKVLYYEPKGPAPLSQATLRLGPLLAGGDYPREFFRQIMVLRSNAGRYVLFEVL